jgi:hypothetical protein
MSASGRNHQFDPPTATAAIRLKRTRKWSIPRTVHGRTKTVEPGGRVGPGEAWSEVWNWRKNVERGIEIFDEALGKAAAFEPPQCGGRSFELWFEP